MLLLRGRGARKILDITLISLAPAVSNSTRSQPVTIEAEFLKRSVDTEGRMKYGNQNERAMPKGVSPLRIVNKYTRLPLDLRSIRRHSGLGIQHNEVGGHCKRGKSESSSIFGNS